MRRFACPWVLRGLWVLLALLALLAPAAQAHLLNMTRVDIDVSPDGSVQARLELDLASELGGPAAYYAASRVPAPLDDPRLAALARAAAAAVNLQHDGARVALRPLSLAMPQDGLETFLSGRAWPRAVLVLQGALQRPANAGAVRVVFEPTFAFEEPIAVTLRNVVTGRTLTRWLIPRQRSPALALGAGAAAVSAADSEPEADPPLTVLWQFISRGFEHILPGGLDHLLFVAGLFLGVRSVRQLLALVSLYTVAHSITLALAAFSIVEVDAAIVEPVIALSIAWVGIENLLWPGGSLRRRMLLVFTLGLVHGLGFAGALRESGLPADGALWALAGFNLGVELGQLTFLTALLAVPGCWRARAWYGVRVVRPASLAITLVALVWTVQRIAG